MSPNIHFEARLLVMGMITGAGLMALYDLLRIFRVLVRHGWLWVGVEDLGYWVFAGFTVFYLLYRENDGALRLYVISAVLLSMVVYDRLVGAFFRKVLKKVGRCFRIRISRRNQR
ncbi:spore cortex biosynthesis protein YabQ [Clostridiaceae bacterium]|nr:spore cortex biosynthesis protein YabQ [Clostridiaceae bacterium]RKI14069.1 spore cortex biosynthesis protein YabQ [bacterium 1XD21-70]